MASLYATIPQVKMSGYCPKPGRDKTVQTVSMIELIARPEKFDGKAILLIGFLKIEFEGNAIYLHLEDYRHSIPQNAVWIEIPDDMTQEEQDEVNMKYVICTGVFRASEHGHMGLFSGTVDNVRRLQPWLDRSVASVSAKTE